MFKHDKFTFIPGNNTVTVNHEGGLFGTLVQTTVDWADITIINPADPKQVLRLLWTDGKAENLETVNALDFLAINDGLTANIWTYVTNGEITGTSAAGKEYTVTEQGNGVFRVTNTDGKFVILDMGASLGRGNMKEWAVGVQRCLTCNNNHDVVFAGIVDHNLEVRGTELNELVRLFWDAVLEYMDKQVVGKTSGLFEGLSELRGLLGAEGLGGALGNRLDAIAKKEHQHRLVALMVGELSSDVEPFPESEGPIKGLAKIYFDGHLGVEVAADRITVLEYVEYYTPTRDRDTIALESDDFLEIGRYLQNASSFKPEDITAERFSGLVMRTIITTAAYEDVAATPCYGFTTAQWNVLSGTVMSLGIPAGDDGWVRVLINAYYLRDYMLTEEVVAMAEKHIGRLTKEGKISARIADRVKVALPEIIRSW